MLNENNINGFLLINKPINYSSYDCIRIIKRIINKKIKIGHTGTLDNFAQGLLIIAIGRESTKKISLFLNADKEYIATGKLGELTDTLDHTGKIIKSEDFNQIPDIKLTDIINNFKGEYKQTPPIYSALKFQGETLYKLAREKKFSEQELENLANDKKRIVNIYNIELLEYKHPNFTIKVHVSKGTYIRSLINDIAEKLGTHATCYELLRTKIGDLDINSAIKLENLKSIEDINNNLINPEKLILLKINK